MFVARGMAYAVSKKIGDDDVAVVCCLLVGEVRIAAGPVGGGCEV